MKILYSITCHTAPDCVIDQLLNFAYFSENCFFVIHVNALEESVFDDLSAINWDLHPTLSGRVLLNPQRFDTSKSSYCLHRAHLANYSYAIQKGLEFDYIMLEASNSQFLRRGMESYISRFDCGIGIALPDPYWKKYITTHRSLEEFLSKNLNLSAGMENFRIKGCHEGMYFSRNLASQVFSVVESLDRFCDSRTDSATYPTEEVWFQVGVLKVLEEKRLRIGHTLTYMPWERQLNWNVEQVEAAINGLGIPETKYIIKRVDRTIDDPVRKFLREKFGGYAKTHSYCSANANINSTA